MSSIARLIIKRSLPDGAETWSAFDVAFKPGQTVLDGLRDIRNRQDPSLAFRYSCTNANTCKECMIKADGRIVYTCTARLEAREMWLEPLPKKATIRDLVTEISPPDERLDGSA